MGIMIEGLLTAFGVLIFILGLVTIIIWLDKSTPPIKGGIYFAGSLNSKNDVTVFVRYADRHIVKYEFPHKYMDYHTERNEMKTTEFNKHFTYLKMDYDRFIRIR
jgi:hypothetical protein